MTRIWPLRHEGLGNSSYLAEVADGLALAAGLGGGPLAVMCGHGEPAMTGASLLAAAGAPGVSVLRGGPADWAKATGQPLAHE